MMSLATLNLTLLRIYTEYRLEFYLLMDTADSDESSSDALLSKFKSDLSKHVDHVAGDDVKMRARLQSVLEDVPDLEAYMSIVNAVINKLEDMVAPYLEDQPIASSRLWRFEDV